MQLFTNKDKNKIMFFLLIIGWLGIFVVEVMHYSGDAKILAFNTSKNYFIYFTTSRGHYPYF